MEWIVQHYLISGKKLNIKSKAPPNASLSEMEIRTHGKHESCVAFQLRLGFLRTQMPRLPVVACLYTNRVFLEVKYGTVTTGKGNMKSITIGHFH